MTIWTATISDNFTRANTSTGGAGTTTGAGNGWIDVTGGIWNINSNTLLGTTSDANGYLSDHLLRPTSENQLNQRVTASFVGTPVANTGMALRYQSGGNYYLAQVWGQTSPFQLIIFLISGGGVTTLVSNSFSGSALITGHVYVADFSAVGASSTALSLQLTDVTASTVYGPITVSDSTSALQVPLQSGLVVWTPGGSAVVNYTNATTYSELAGSMLALGQQQPLFSRTEVVSY